MYFQNLKSLKTDNIQVKVLDEWLASLSPIYYKNINPVDFALMYKLEYKNVLMLFNEAKKAGVLKVKFIVRDSDDMPVGTYGSMNDIPRSFFNFERNSEEAITEEMIELWFELIDRPKSLPLLAHDKRIGNSASPNLIEMDRQEGGTLDLIYSLGF